MIEPDMTMELPRGLKVLVADDNVPAAEVLAMALELLGQKTCVVHDGERALVLAVEFLPDLAILDIGMPKLDGLEVARALRGTPALAGTRLVALSGWGQPQDRKLALEAGFDRHLPKPIGIEMLEELLRETAAHRLPTPG
jgi:CheY-like chemotaxis protein